ncbi:hypothetical protein B0H34DRAFT_678790 [Crassisporium funariophilum]|nr:hypothetical protein B0H34DRAFT_678790 [Crassisporium funariophilum]
MVLELIGKALTAGRYTLKSKIVKGLEGKKDIATLTEACIGSSKAKASVALYIHMAFIQREWKKFLVAKGTGTVKDDTFWIQVDNELKEMRAKYNTSHKLQIAHEVIYEQDKAEYGEPVVSSDFTMLKDLNNWLITLNQGVSRVQAK